jgi:3-phenylpropionate/cinnamic acid dioxygenase small subunit
MAISTDDRLAIYELLALHGHLMDAGDFDRLNELFTEDFAYDLAHLGYGQLQGAKAIIEAAIALGDDNPLGHHVTNSLVIAEEDNGVIRVRSKGIGIRADGSCGTVVYDDLVRQTDGGWRIARRTVIPRRRSLQP